jgi:hypothetical protein
MADGTLAYFRLARIDGTPLPVELEYGDAQCLVADGDLVLREGTLGEGDGIVCIRLFGSAFGLSQMHQIFLEREPFDRLDDAHLTFPGGFRRRQGISPHSLIRYTEDGIELTALTSDLVHRRAKHTFRSHRWSFVATMDRLPDSDAAAG